MLERARTALFFALILLALSEVSPFASTKASVWVADALHAEMSSFNLASEQVLITFSLIASWLFIFLLVCAVSLALVLRAEKRAPI